MDCKTARLLLEFHRPRAGELPSGEAAELERHLASCPECDAAVRAARRLDDCLGSALRAVPVPPRLRDRLLTRLTEQRRSQRRARLVWAARGFAVASAAAIVAAVVLWQAYLKPAKVNLDIVAASQQDKYGSPSPEHVEQWFQQQRHITMVAPKQFEYAYLAEYDLAELQGKTVPKLVFQHDDLNGITRARVFVLGADQFDFADLPEGSDLRDSGGQHIDIRKESPQTAYLIVYDGDSLKPPLVRAAETQ